MSDSRESERKGHGPAAVSCAECRRSKLKCDRTVPCHACIRRGCSHLCPNGTMTATKGNKTLVSQAQQLAKDLKAALARIKALEDALKAATSASHPLLTGLRAEPMKSSMAAAEPVYEELYEGRVHETTEMMGSLLVGADGKTRHLGESASSDFLLTLIDPSDTGPELDPREIACYGMPSEIVELSNAFPMGVTFCAIGTDNFTEFLPPRSRALELVDLYYAEFTRLHLPIPRPDLIELYIDPIYQGNEVGSAYAIHPHKLSVIFIVLASGAVFDNPAFASTLAHQYCVLSRACLSLKSVVREANIASVQAVYMNMWFLHTTSHDNSNEERWLLQGTCVKIAQIIGLQRDSAGWNMDEDEVQRRRVLWWEIYTYDAWSSVKTGRPPSINLQYTDCRYPKDHDPVTVISNDAKELSFQAWKFRFSVSGLTPIMHYFFGVRKSSYAELLELDKKIRQVSPPDHLKAPMNLAQTNRSWSSDPRKAMQQFTILAVIESNLLYIHRSYFARAIHEEPLNPLKHKYAPSVMASYRSAHRMICGLRDLYAIHPETTNQQHYFWATLFSACVVFAALVIESPGSSLAQEAAPGLELALSFFQTVRSKESSSESVLTMLQRLLKRAQDAFAAFHSTNSPQVGILPNGNINDVEPDELAILGGRQSIITPRSTSHSPAAQSTNSSSASPESFQPIAAFNFDVTAGTVAPDPAMQKDDDFDMSIFFNKHASGEQQEMSDWSLFNTPSFEHENTSGSLHTETYRSSSVVDQNYGLPEKGDLTATMMAGDGVIWSMFANQLLP
ncbi:hypothetical protein FIBSPDRAFT_775692 [Athelia psychrophila]|uniref:Zn(2)-C6 fungal-type domain-containing protein n=1 Tax=Athelia psychrophila TaxID=1759441 RepID=A0A166UHD3_9AGAM|nr:hypothetical protein FIBSPDRAFT_775692 [Fibularhizoctonia sp. CBS 109695]